MPHFRTKIWRFTNQYVKSALKGLGRLRVSKGQAQGLKGLGRLRVSKG